MNHAKKAKELWDIFVKNNPCNDECEWPDRPPLMFEYGVSYALIDFENRIKEVASNEILRTNKMC